MDRQAELARSILAEDIAGTAHCYRSEPMVVVVEDIVGIVGIVQDFGRGVHRDWVVQDSGKVAGRDRDTPDSVFH